jgi:hypothetical protein
MKSCDKSSIRLDTAREMILIESEQEFLLHSTEGHGVLKTYPLEKNKINKLAKTTTKKPIVNVFFIPKIKLTAYP